ncbi:MAG: M67 family metallopeptidase [Acidimicrobiales bacterium]|jgi:proteasome lid subunit RPN8/RPN11
MSDLRADTRASGATGLQVSPAQLDEIIAHCLRAYPDEGCGLLTGEFATGIVALVCPTRNIAASAQIYTVDPGQHLRIERAAEADGLEVIGVFHSHTHTDPYPSPTDIAQAPDPSWHYVLVSLRHEVASVRSYRIVEGLVTEEPVEVH